MGLDLPQEDAEADAAFAPAAAPAAVSPGGTLTREPSAVFSSKPEARANPHPHPRPHPRPHPHPHPHPATTCPCLQP